MPKGKKGEREKIILLALFILISLFVSKNALGATLECGVADPDGITVKAVAATLNLAEGTTSSSCSGTWTRTCAKEGSYRTYTITDNPATWVTGATTSNPTHAHYYSLFLGDLAAYGTRIHTSQNISWDIPSPNTIKCCRWMACIDLNGTCLVADSPHTNLKSGDDDNKAFCKIRGDTTSWVDCDDNNTDNCGLGSNVTSGEANVGEYPNTHTNMFCGDDAQEYYKYGQAVLAPIDEKCCNNAYDCVDSEGVCRDNGFYLPGWTCINGKWVCNKVTWDGNSTGCCERGEQCLVNPRGDENASDKPEKWFQNQDTPSKMPRCIKSGQYILDNLCADGRWQSRTEYIAAELLRVPRSNNEDYVVFCDTYEHVLNYYRYPLPGNIPLEAYLLENGECGRFPCFNNFCVLVNTSSGAVKEVGASLNPDSRLIYDYAKVEKILNLTRTSCPTPQAFPGSFANCGKGVRYNANLSSFVYSSTLTRTAGSFSTALSFLTNNFRNLMPLYIRGMPYDTWVNNRINNYNNTPPNLRKLFVLRNGNKGIFSTMPVSNQTERMFLNYTGFDTDFCKGIKGYFEEELGNCTIIPSGKNQNIFANRTGENSNPLMERWYELTAGLRIDIPVCEGCE